MPNVTVGGRQPVRDSVKAILEAETEGGIAQFETYFEFGGRVEAVRSELRRTVTDLTRDGRTIAGYGAPSTGTTLLSFCGLGHEVIEYIVDDNPLKQGLVTPGTHVPIMSVAELRARPPDYVLIIAWRLKDEILSPTCSAAGTYQGRHRPPSHPGARLLRR